jgi:general nucleoside transport system ATP-binding protein
VTAVVELQGITKRFPGVVANDEVTFSVEPGEIHALCGENGAGKSTLMKILYGMQPPDEGTMLVDGAPVHFRSPKDAIALGIGMVHQHFMLADNFTVLENIVLGSEPVLSAGRLDLKTARARVEELSAAYGLGIHPDDVVEELEVGERQRVEIIKVLFRGARILILDEPTAVLVPDEVDELFRNLRELKANGVTVIFIDHKLDEVLEISDRITVLRAGRTVGTRDAGSVSAAELAEMMVGSELPSPATGETTVTDTVAFAVNGLTVLGDDKRVLVDGVDLVVRRGEVVGVAGVEGNGQAELIEALLGLRQSTGSIELEGTDIASWSVRDRRRAGLGYIPEDRHRRGLLLDSPLWENAMLGHQANEPYAHGMWLDRTGARARTEAIVERYDVRTPNIDVTARALSGGNQQKLIIGREMMGDPKVLIAAHPTRGIDVGAQAAVWNHLRQARVDGLAVLLVSADLDELIGLSDTLVVMLRGRLVATLDPATVTPRELGSWMTGAALDKGDAA